MTLTADQVRALLRGHVTAHYRTQNAAAAAWGVSSPFVNRVLQGVRRPTGVMLEAIGIEPVIRNGKRVYRAIAYPILVFDAPS